MADMVLAVCSYFLNQGCGVVSCGQTAAEGQQFYAETLPLNQLCSRFLPLTDGFGIRRHNRQRSGQFVPPQSCAAAAEILVKRCLAKDMQVNILRAVPG